MVAAPRRGQLGCVRWALVAAFPLLCGCSVIGGFAGASTGQYETWAESSAGGALRRNPGLGALRRGDEVRVENRSSRAYEGRYLGTRHDRLGVETDSGEFWVPLNEVERVEIRTGSYTGLGVAAGIAVDAAVLLSVCGGGKCGVGPR